MTQPTDTILSRRAQDASTAGSKNLMWDVLNNLWCPLTNPDGYVNVGVAENVLMHDQFLSFINTKLDLPAKYLTYNDGGSGSLRLKRALSQFLNRYLHPAIPLNPRHLIVTNGVSSAIEHVSWAFTDPGEGILLGKPYYGTFIPDMSLRPGATVISVNFGDCDPFSIEAVDRYEEALLAFQQTTNRKVKALMLCHPHNPLGRCYPRDVIIKMMHLCQKYNLHLISDEIYALSVWKNTVDDQLHPPVEFESALSIDLNGIIDPRLVHVLWGMSKDFGANGLRLGVIISQSNSDLHQALKGISLYSYASGVSDHLTSLLLEDSDFTDEYIRRNRDKLSESYTCAVQYIRGHNIEYAQGCNAAFFLWVNLGKKYCQLHPGGNIEDVSDKVMQVLLRKKVFLASGDLFGSEHPGWFRIVFSQPREYLNEALRRITDALALKD
ncbi:hypothetical protein PENARI_c001G02058 [Penicillium arizonense]|uniref:Aminotransferase class I/classII large domain-containing protein n=1 Tax=Penicillium arizonense TaxID=1835702 RepID=A0A1F5LYA0_PENAI|nr:hypothetical protein PENARI_c001G02058 [Penicillium arizonense]OGE57969.1 hypothetical protein PENARI_c001G02058 [Penicillium arizonense]